MNFKVGDKVTHKLGGGEMIVIVVGIGAYPVMCRRYNKTKNDFETRSFTREELNLVKEEEHLI